LQKFLLDDVDLIIDVILQDGLLANFALQFFNDPFLDDLHAFFHEFVLIVYFPHFVLVDLLQL
jgi:hypothetical protein